MTITFKNVGQGDTIILEWEKEGVQKIGIIDCKKVKKSNPVVEHIIKKNYTQIEFVIVSHPHYDHFSGIFSLLEHCEQNNINIIRFGHSFRTTTENQYYLDWANLTNYRTGQLYKMIQKAESLYSKNKCIQKYVVTEEDWHYRINSTYRLHCIRPSGIEIRNNYYAAVDRNKNSIDKKKRLNKTSKVANYYSTILLLESDKHFLLLTSDVTFDTINGILNKDFEEYFLNKKLLLGQIPHHGSIKNHNIRFWRKLNKDINMSLAVSAGNHTQYGHPDEKVILNFGEEAFKVYSTNHVGEMTEFLKNKAKKVSDKLDMSSEIYSSGRDWVFSIDEDYAYPT